MKESRSGFKDLKEMVKEEITAFHTLSPSQQSTHFTLPSYVPLWNEREQVWFCGSEGRRAHSEMVKEEITAVHTLSPQ